MKTKKSKMEFIRKQVDPKGSSSQILVEIDAINKLLEQKDACNEQNAEVCEHPPLLKKEEMLEDEVKLIHY